MKKRLLTFCFCLITIAILNAQIDPKFYGKKEDFKAMAKCTLLVELLEEDPETIKYLSKKEKRAAELERYKTHIVDYNSMIKASVPKFWTFNTLIEYKTWTEIDVLRKAKAKKSVVLCYRELSDGDFNQFTRSDLNIPAFYYTKLESKSYEPDYKCYIPSSFIRSNGKYLEADFKFGLLAMQANLNWIMKNEKAENIEDYSEKAAEVNCGKLKELTLLLEKSILYEKTSEEEARTAFEAGKFEFTTESEINKAFMNKLAGKAVLFVFPYGLMKGGAGPISTTQVVYFKIIADCVTGDILWSNNPGSFPIGKNVSKYLVEKDFKNISKCKFK